MLYLPAHRLRTTRGTFVLFRSMISPPLGFVPSQNLNYIHTSWGVLCASCAFRDNFRILHINPKSNQVPRGGNGVPRLSSTLLFTGVVQYVETCARRRSHPPRSPDFGPKRQAFGEPSTSSTQSLPPFGAAERRCRALSIWRVFPLVLHVTVQHRLQRVDATHVLPSCDFLVNACSQILCITVLAMVFLCVCGFNMPLESLNPPLGRAEPTKLAEYTVKVLGGQGRPSVGIFE